MSRSSSISCLLHCHDSANVRAIFEASNDAVVFTDADRRILWCNRPFEMLLGYPLADVRGTVLDTLYRRFDDDHAAEKHLFDSLSQASGSGYPMTYIHKTGVAVETTTIAWSLTESDASVVGHIKILHDRTETNRLERARRRLFRISTEQKSTPSEKIEELLALACEFLMMPIGLVSLLDEEEKLCIHQAKSTLTPILTGGTYNPGDTDCARVLASRCFHEYHEAPQCRPHPLVPYVGVRSYVGVPLFIGTACEGTLNFLNPLPRLALGRSEREMVTAISEVIAFQIALDRRTRALERAATEDWLTGASSSRQFRHDLEAIFRTVRRNDSTASLVLFDIDHFKSINDSYGHDMGDRVLSEIAAFVRANLPPRLRLYRVGGEEFAIILPGSQADNGAILAEQIRQRLTMPNEGWDDLPSVTASFGVAALDPDITCADAWMKCADVALYASKNSGRNRVTSNGTIAGVDIPSLAPPSSKKVYSKVTEEIFGKKSAQKPSEVSGT